MPLPAYRLVELSHTLEPGMPRFSRAAPAPLAKPWLSHAQAAEFGHYKGCSCEISQVEFVASLGTYLDSPYHFHADMGDIASLDLDKLVLPGLVVDCTDCGPAQPIGPDRLAGLDINGKAVLFHTGYDRYWGRDAYFEHPFLAAETAQALIAAGAGLAGIDVLVIDSTDDPARPVHVNLLKNEILIVENLTGLGGLPTENFLFSAAPLRFAGAASFPVRAYGLVLE